MALQPRRPTWRDRDRQLRRVRALIFCAVVVYGGLTATGTFVALEGLKLHGPAPVLLGLLLLTGGYAGMRLCAATLERP